MQGRERKILRAALRGCHEALAEIEPSANGERPATPLLMARTLRALLEGQIAVLEALAAGEGGGPAEPEAASPAPPPPARQPTPTPAPTLAPSEPPAGDGPPRVGTDMTRVALAAFAVEDIARWIGSGTVFQIRGTLAFLNMDAMGGAKVEEMRGHIKRMGFATEHGKLEAEGVTGRIILFQRPE